MKLLSTTSLLCLTTFVTGVVGEGAYQKGYKAGEKDAKDLWKKEYKSDCNNIFTYSVKVKDDLVNDKYKADKDDNWWDDAYNKGGRDGAQKKAVEYQKKCIDPSYCDELGTTAAELIIADFCEVRTAFAARERSPIVFCRKSATVTCQGKLLDTIEQFDTCPEIDNDVENLTREQWYDLSDECEDQVDDMIEWDELKPTTSTKDSVKSDSRSKSKSKSKSSKSKKKSKKKKKKKKKKKSNRILLQNQGLRGLKDVYAMEQK